MNEKLKTKLSKSGTICYKQFQVAFRINDMRSAGKKIKENTSNNSMNEISQKVLLCQ